MKKNLVTKTLFVGLLTIATLFGACGDSNDNSRDTATDAVTTTTSSEAASMADVSVTDADDGSTQSIAAGQRLVIKLDVNGGTGYSWPVTTAPDAKVLKQVSQTQAKKEGVETTAPGGSPMVGTPETVTTTFEAVAAGTTKVVLSLTPPGGGKAEDTFTITVTVTA